MDEDLLTQFPNDIQSLCEKGQEYVTFYNLEEALVHYRQALDHIESISTPCDNIDRLRCDIYLHICYIYTLKNQWETAKSYYDIGKYLADKLQDKIRIAHYLDKQALILRWQGDFDKALECCGKSLDIKINYLGTYLHTDVAHSYHQLARIYDDGGKYQESLAMIRKAREIRLKVLDENHPDIAYSYHTEGIFYVRQGNFKKALSMLNIAHKIRLRLFGNRHLLIANSLQIMAVCRSYLGQHKVAFTMLNNVLYIRLALLSKNHAHIADTYEHMGDVGSNNGDYQQAISKYNLSLDMRHTIFPQKNHFAIARAYRKFGNVYVKQGQYNLASGILEKSLQMQLSTLNRDHPEIAKTLFGIAKIYIDLNRYEDALSIYNKSMQIRPSAVDFDYSFIAELYNGQGVIYKEQGKYDEALSMFHKTIKAILPALGENHPYVKMTRNHVATTRQQQQAHYYQSTTLAERYFNDLVRWFGVFTGTDANNLTTLTNRNSNGSNPDSDIIRHTEDEVLGEKKYYNLYNKALNNCYCFNDLIHGKFIGPPSIGKSSIAKVFTQQESNKNKPPDKVVNHSDGILKTEFNQFYCLQNSKTYNFTEVLDDKIKTAIREFSVAELESQQNNDMQKSNKSQQDQLTMADNLSLTIVKDDDKQSSMSSDNIADASNKTESKFSFAESYAPRINENKDKFEDNQYVKVWDFSDPAIYHVCQYLFRSSNSIYFLVFSIEQGVKDLVKTREGQLLNMTYSQAIQELLVSIICCHSSRNQVYVNIDDRDAEFSLPIIILVASHSDCTTEVEERNRRYDEYVDELISSMPSYTSSIYSSNIIFNCNLNDSSPSAVDQRRECCNRLHHIIKTFSFSLQFIHEPFPFRRYIMATILNKCIRSHHNQGMSSIINQIQDTQVRNIMTMQQIVTLSQECGLYDSYDELRAVLMYLHELGEVIYCDKIGDNGMIITNVDWLLNIFRAIIQLKDHRQGSLQAKLDYNIAYKTGKLPRRYVDNALNRFNLDENSKEIILKLMESYDILFCIRIELDDTTEEWQYFVPYLLPRNVKPFDLRKYHASDWLYIGYEKGDIPYGIYHSLLSSCLIQWNNKVVELYYQCAKYYLANDDHYLIIKKEGPYIGLQYCYQKINQLDIGKLVIDKVKNSIFNKRPHDIVKNKLISIVDKRMIKFQGARCRFYVKCNECNEEISIAEEYREEDSNWIRCEYCTQQFASQSLHDWMIYNKELSIERWIDVRDDDPRNYFHSIASCVGIDWTKLATVLDPTIDTEVIEAKHRGHTYNSAIQSLNQWYRRKYPNATLNLLRNALETIDRNDIIIPKEQNS